VWHYCRCIEAAPIAGWLRTNSSAGQRRIILVTLDHPYAVPTSGDESTCCVAARQIHFPCVAAAQQRIMCLQCAALTHLASHDWLYVGNPMLIHCCICTHLDVWCLGKPSVSQAQIDLSASLPSKTLSWYLLLPSASSGKVSSTGKAGKAGSSRFPKDREPFDAAAART
jgi:hypothetical protein